MARKNVNAQFVRTWLSSDEGQAALKAANVTLKVGSRGRHNPAQVAVFKKHNKGLTYTEKVAETPTFTVKFPGKDSRGRKCQKRRTLTNAEARAILGQPTSAKGPIPMKRLVDALAEV